MNWCQNIIYELDVFCLSIVTPLHGFSYIPQEERSPTIKIAKMNNTNCFIQINFYKNTYLIIEKNTSTVYIFVKDKIRCKQQASETETDLIKL